MYDVLSVAEGKAAEARAKKYGLNEDILIENAAAVLYESVISRTVPEDCTAVFAGGGNNGADGLSLARKLALAGRKVRVFLTSESQNAFAAARLCACSALGVPVTTADGLAAFRPKDYTVIVDAMIGTGLSRPVSGTMRDVIDRINASKVYTLAVDIPSGLNADTGTAESGAVCADETVTFTAVKPGQLIGDGRNYIGRLSVADIGVRGSGKIKVCTGEDLKLPPRRPVGHKYHYGRVRVIAGSPDMPGAALLAAESATAALKSGAGLVSLCVADSLADAYRCRVRESTLVCMPDREGYITFDADALDGIMDKAGAIAVGMGMGQNPDLPQTLNYLAKNFGGTLVIDADGLNALSRDLSVLAAHKAKIVLTPHLGEFERLAAGTDDPTAGVPLTERVRVLAARLDAVVAAKSATTVISDGDRVFLNATGTPAMAKGGSGDVLAGMIAALSCRLDPLRAALTGCYYLGKCGEEAERRTGSESLLAGDLVAAIRLL